MSKSMMELAAEIVTAQSTKKTMTQEEIAASLAKVYEILVWMRGRENGEDAPVSIQSVQPAQAPQPFMEHAAKPLDRLREAPRKSIKNDSVICLECGLELKMLNKKHLASHGLTAESYREKWGFEPRQALASKTLSEQRREVAKRNDLGRKMIAARKAKRASRAESAPLPEEADYAAPVAGALDSWEGYKALEALARAEAAPVPKTQKKRGRPPKALSEKGAPVAKRKYTKRAVKAEPAGTVKPGVAQDSPPAPPEKPVTILRKRK